MIWSLPKKTLERHRLLESRAEFFDRIETEDARRQLQSSDDDTDDWGSGEVQHRVEERRLVVKLLCERPPGGEPQSSVWRRINAANALLSLCRTEQTTIQRRTQRNYDWGIPPSPEPTPEPVLVSSNTPTQINNRQCIFCLCKQSASQEFCRHRKAREHVEKQHLKWFGQDDLIPCPDEYCRRSGIVLYGHQHFKSHVSKVHGAQLLPYSLH